MQKIIFLINLFIKLSYHYNKYQQMGKNKPEKLTPSQKKAKKEEMKQILKKLQLIKEENKDKILKFKPVALVGTSLKKDKDRKNSFKSSDDIQEQQSQTIQKTNVPPKINIFGVEKFQIQQSLLKPKQIKHQKQYQLSLEDIARKELGQNMNFDTFLQKPLHKMSVQVESQSEDQNKPNPYPDLKLPTGHIQILRNQQITQFRSQLPILGKQQEIVELINNHPVVLVCGETGSGKSTQIPQFLFQKNYTSFGMIGVTQPRRLAAVALAQRVSEEMAVELGTDVGYQVRHQKHDTQQTKIKFMTDGILLNQISSDILLLKYSVIIIDEAHERKINSDLLVGLLSKLVEIRYRMSNQGKCYPLRLVIMSATMRVQDFNNKTLFPHLPPIAKIEARMFPVTTYFAKTTPKDYVAEAVKKCVKIHQTLPSGDVLVFLTGKEQILKMVSLLNVALEQANYNKQRQNQQSDDEQEDDRSDIQYEKEDQYANQIQHQVGQNSSYQILPLYSSLPLEEQRLIFQPSTKRRFIISTNIAETSLTIPKIRYVIDSGHEKYKHFDKIWRWYIGWGTKAMAEQRAGRAGRVAHGYCYRLYSTAVYTNTMKQFPDPQITKVPLQNVILQLKAVGIQDVLRFPFPTSPQRTKMIQSVNNLIELDAVQGESLTSLAVKDQTKITQLGKVLSFIPLQPIYGKLLLIGRSKNVAKYMLYLVLSLTVQVLISHSFKTILMEKEDLQEDDETDIIKKFSKAKEAQKNLLKKNIQQRKAKNMQYKTKYMKFYTKGSDVFLNMNIIGQYFAQILSRKSREGESYDFDKATKQICKRQGLMENSLREVFRNGEQIIEIYETMTGEILNFKQYEHPNKQQADRLLSGLLECYLKSVVHLQEKSKYKVSEESFVYLHPSSFLYSKPPLFLGYIDTFQTNRTYMRYPFVVKNFKFLADHGKTNPIEYPVWQKNLFGVASGQYKSWTLPKFRVLVEGQQKYFYISKLLLEGKIVKIGDKNSNKWDDLKIDTKVITINNKKDPRVGGTVRILESLGLDSDDKFQQEMNKRPEFLLQIIKLWHQKQGLHKNPESDIKVKPSKLFNLLLNAYRKNTKQ